MSKLSRSSELGQFSITVQQKKLKKNPEDKTSQDMIDLFMSESDRHRALEEDPEWQKNNLEYDLRSTDWICQKVRNSRVYGQNLYAALCNNDFQKLDTMPILKNQIWHCSWRYAGGIIADMDGKGDYIDWYCSGIRGGMSYDDPADNDPTVVTEGEVTDEIRNDLKQVGWIVVTDETN